MKPFGNVVQRYLSANFQLRKVLGWKLLRDIVDDEFGFVIILVTLS